MEHTEPSNRTVRLHLLVAGLVLLGLLCWDLGGRELWTDEEFSLAAAAPLQQAALGDASHPPLYPVLLHFWLQGERGRSPYADVSDGWLRAFSVPWALLAWWLGWLIAARLGLKREGLIAAWLMALSPLVMTYFRLGRYYSLAAAVTMLAVYLLVRLWAMRTWVASLLLGLGMAVVGYTDYVGFLVVVTLLGLSVLMALVRRERQLAGQAAVAALAAIGLLYPIILMTLHRTGVVGLIAADPLSGSAWGFLVKLALPVFSLATGECVDPWRWWVTAPAVVATGVLLVGGLRAMVVVRQPAAGPVARRTLASAYATPAAFIALAWPLNILIGAVMMSTVAANVPPNRITSFAMFTIPLAYLMLARGVTAVSRRSASFQLARVLLAIVIGAYALGLWNYFHRQQLLNPGFASPWREVSRLIEANEQPGDRVLAIENAFWRYYDGRGAQGREPQIHEMLAGKLPFDRRVWLLTRDRGSQEMLGYGLQLREMLLAQGATERVWNIMPRSPQEQRFLTLMLRRPAWDAYVKLYLFTPPTSARDDVGALTRARPAGPKR